jgi:23S rRNA pseudouridine2605 synthase
MGSGLAESARSIALASLTRLCYQARMTDSNDDDRRRGPRGRSDRRGASGDRPFRGREGGREGGGGRGAGKPFRAKERGHDAKERGRDQEGPYRGRRDQDAGPRKPREGAGRPFGRRDGDERPFRARDEDGRPRRPALAAGDRRGPRHEEPAGTAAAEPVEERIAKVIARAGVASRRDAEAMIEQGRVTLNGEVLTSPAVNVTAADAITVDGEPLPAKERTRLWIFHKPRGLVTTARDPEGRPTVFDQLPEDLPRVVTIGRLDINTEGLLLLTNDGGLARVIAHPDTGWLRRYKVRAHGEVTQADLDRLAGGVTIDEMEYGPVEARLDRVQGDNVWITMGLREGKNREVKRILEHLGLQVNRLIRLSFGPFQLGDLEQGLVEEVRTRVLKDQLGAKLAEEAGVDFESPVREPIAPFGSPKKRAGAEGREERDERERRYEPRGGRERPRRRDEGDHRPHRRDDDDRPHRFHRDEPAGRSDEAPAHKRPSRNEPKRSVWRAEEDEAGARRGHKAPRRGADPREARSAAAERPRQRVGAISSGEGRKVVVERLVSDRPDERPVRKPRREGPPRPAPGAEDRPRRPRPAGDRPFRPRRDDDERTQRGPARGDGPSRRGARTGPGGGGFKGGGFKGGPGGSRGGPGGSRGGPKGPPKGPPRGPARGPARGRRP